MKTIDTRLVHAGEPRPRFGGAVSLPVFQSATFESAGESDYHSVRYIRLNNTPNHLALAAKLAAIENAEAAMVTASGMAAISTALLTVLGSGDHLLAQDCLYGGTHDLLTKDLPGLGIAHDLIAGDDPLSWRAKLRPETKAIYVESMTNPLLQAADLEAVIAFAKEHDLVTLIDNTFASPVNFRPAEIGFDLILHSGTKYLNGHSDIVAGAVIGKAGLVERVLHKLNHLGGTLDPHACFLFQRGMKTLALRVRQQNITALAVAEMLAGHPAVTRVNHLGLPSHPHHERASRLFDGYGGMLSFELDGGADAADRFLENVQLPLVAPSLGGVESLVTIPARTSHLGLTPEDRAVMGIGDGLIRVSIGIEGTDELVDDIRQAVDKVTG